MDRRFLSDEVVGSHDGGVVYLLLAEGLDRVDVVPEDVVCGKEFEFGVAEDVGDPARRYDWGVLP